MKREWGNALGRLLKQFSSFSAAALEVSWSLASSYPVDVCSSSAVGVDYALPVWIYGSCCENSGNTRARGIAGLKELGR